MHESIMSVGDPSAFGTAMHVHKSLIGSNKASSGQVKHSLNYHVGIA